MADQDGTPRLICPLCGFSREVSRERLPSRPVRATCPGCKGSFLFDPAVFSAMPDPPVPPHKPPRMDPTPLTPPEHEPPPPPKEPTPPRPASAPSRPPRRPAAAPPQLRGISELLSAAWQMFQARFGVLFAIYLLTILLAVVPPLLGMGIGMILLLVLPFGKGGVMALSAVAGGIPGLVGSFWGCGALLSAALNDSLDVRGSFAAAKNMALPLLWVCLLTGFVVTGGYLLLFIPGLIFSVWFLMSPFVLLDDDTRGLSALLKSRALVQGRWFDLFLRLVVIWVVAGLIGAVPIAGPLLVLVATPYVVLYQALLYKDLKAVAGLVAYPCSLGDKARWPLVAVIGYIAIPAVLLAICGVTILDWVHKLPGSGTLHIAGINGKPAPGSDAQWRVIPIPGKMDGAPSANPAQPPAEGVTQGEATQRAKVPDHVHIFIYAVNCPGSVSANGVELQRIEDKPDMQFNYNLNGEKLSFGRNTITVDYSPMTVSGNMLKPSIHIKISASSGGQRQVLGEWRIQETSAGQKSFDLDVPEPPAQQGKGGAP